MEYKAGWRHTAQMLDLNIPVWKCHALDYLERIGQRFCVDFGTDNAVQKAREHWRNRRLNRKRPVR